MHPIDSRMLFRLLSSLSPEIRQKTLPYFLLTNENVTKCLCYGLRKESKDTSSYWPEHRTWREHAEEYIGKPDNILRSEGIDKLRPCCPRRPDDIVSLKDQFISLFDTVYTVYYDGERLNDAKNDILETLKNAEAPEEDVASVAAMDDFSAIARFLVARAQNRGKSPFQKRGSAAAPQKQAQPSAVPAQAAAPADVFSPAELRRMLTDTCAWAAAAEPVGKINLPVQNWLFRTFPRDKDFLAAVLPGPALERIDSFEASHPGTVSALMAGQCPDELAHLLCMDFRGDSGYRFRQLVHRAKCLIEESAGPADWNACMALLAGQPCMQNAAAQRMEACCQRADAISCPERRLAALILYALLGKAHFLQMFRQESDYVYLVTVE